MHSTPPRRLKRRAVLSERIARPNAITTALKQLHKFTCQICHVEGFRQANGSPYAEAHHIIQLSEGVAGSLASDNIIVVCPTCHRKLHRALVTYSELDGRTI